MKRLAAFTALLIVLAVPARAGWEEGVAAYDRGDYATALREFRPLADQGYASAQFNLGVMYGKGQGMPQDHAEAVRWYLVHVIIVYIYFHFRFEDVHEALYAPKFL